MEYPLYEYYKNRSLTLDEIVDHYVTRFYAKKHDGRDVLKVLNKINESDKIKNLCGQSATRGIAPNYVDFSTCVHSIFWFAFKPTDTIVLATLFAILYWDERINRIYYLKPSDEVRDDAIKVFKKFQIYGDLSEEMFLNETIEGNEERKKREEIAKQKMAIENEINSIKESWPLDEFLVNNSINKMSIRYTLNGCICELHRYVIRDKEKCASENTIFGGLRRIEASSTGPDKLFASISIPLIESGMYKRLDVDDTNMIDYSYINSFNIYSYLRVGLVNPNSITPYLIYEDADEKKKVESAIRIMRLSEDLRKRK